MKKLVQIGGVMVLLGVAVLLTGYQFSQHDLSIFSRDLIVFGRKTGSVSSAEMTDMTYDCDLGSLRKIELDEDTAEVRLRPSPDDLIHVLYQDSDARHLQISVSGGTLTLRRVSTSRLVLFGSSPSLVTMLEIPVPSDVELKIRTDTGSISAEGLDTGLDARFESDTGRIVLRDLTLRDLVLDSGTGHTELSGSCRDVDIESDTGSSAITGLTCRSFKLDSDTGSVTLTDLDAEADLQAETDTGSITLQNVSAGHTLSFKTDTGGIRGVLAGTMSDYSISAGSGTGRCNLPSQSGGSGTALKVKSGTGSIDISFAGD